jgi:hypothetical protein
MLLRAFYVKKLITKCESVELKAVKIISTLIRRQRGTVLGHVLLSQQESGVQLNLFCGIAHLVCPVELVRIRDSECCKIQPD